MRKGIGVAVLGLGLLGLGWWAHGHHGPRIQDHVRQLAETAVAPSIHGATVTVSGRRSGGRRHAASRPPHDGSRPPSNG